MKVILLENIEKVGAKYEEIVVKSGFGRNYLIPQGKAMVANVQNLGKLKGIRRSSDAKANQMLSTYQQWVAKINAGGKIRIEMKAGDSGRLFGSVSASTITNLLNEKYGITLERRQVVLSDIKELGEFTAKLDLHKSLPATVDVEVVREGEPDRSYSQPAYVAPVAEKVVAAAPVVEAVAETIVAAPVVEEVVAVAEEVVAEAAPVVEETVETVAEEVVETVAEAADEATEEATA